MNLGIILPSLRLEEKMEQEMCGEGKNLWDSERVSQSIHEYYQRGPLVFARVLLSGDTVIAA